MLGPLLEAFPKSEDSNLLVGTSTSDDGGVYQLNPDLAIVQTVDYFTPIVDDPFIFGQIAATNSLSDIYAMGGIPLTALNILCFPDNLGTSVLKEILAGGHQKISESGAVLLGGHSVTDPILKYGMSVTGKIHPQKIKTNATSQHGDILILTKPLGTGIIATAAKKGKVSEQTLKESIDVMSELNKVASHEACEMGGPFNNRYHGIWFSGSWNGNGCGFKSIFRD